MATYTVMQKRGKWAVRVRSCAIPNKAGEVQRLLKPEEFTRADAEELGRKLAAHWTEREAELPDPSTGLPATAVLEEYLEAVPLARSTRSVQASLIRAHLGPWFGQRDLAEVDRAEVRQFLMATARKAGPTTAGKAVETLRRVYNLLAAEGAIGRYRGRVEGNPAAGWSATVRRLKADRSEAPGRSYRDAWTAEEVQRLLAKAAEREPVRLYPVLVFCFETGCRPPGEPLALRWEDVDVARGVAHVWRSRPRGAERAATKTGEGRVVQLSDAALQVLAALRESRDPEPGDYVFPGDRGGPACPKVLGRLFREARDAAKVRPFTLYSTRHTFASHALAAGANPLAIARQGGWARVETMLQNYAHALPGEDAPLGVSVTAAPGTPGTGRERPGTAERPEPQVLEKWRARHDSNVRPSGPQPDALSN